MSFKAYTFNLQHGVGTDNVTDYQRQVTAFSSGDLIAAQERSSPDSGWDTPLSNGGFSQSIYKANIIGGGDGNTIWYKGANVTIAQTYERQLSIGATSPWDGIPTNVDKSAVAARCTVEGQQFYFVSTHLSQAAGADSDGSLFSVIRENQIKELLKWINSDLLGLDVLIAADFNYGPNYLLTGGGFQMDLFLRAGFVDLWRQGISQGVATASWGDRNSDATPDQTVDDNTVTHDVRRIDGFYLRTVNRALTLSAIDVPDLRATCGSALTGNPAFCPDTHSSQRWGNSGDFGVRPTDHNPVAATFSINQTAARPVRATQFSWHPKVNL
jgi:endonuclease/exonuclease/phosphatase family metal-dependent hydrolase